MLAVQPALGDLGVAQGPGKEAKNLQAARVKTAFDRLRWVARFGLPRQALCRLAVLSALVAGMCGAACHVYDRDTLKTLRSWVMFAHYRGSRFAQPRLFVHLALPSSTPDLWQVALRKGCHAGELVRQEWGEDIFWQIWDGSKKDGP